MQRQMGTQDYRVKTSKSLHKVRDPGLEAREKMRLKMMGINYELLTCPNNYYQGPRNRNSVFSPSVAGERYGNECLPLGARREDIKSPSGMDIKMDVRDVGSGMLNVLAQGAKQVSNREGKVTTMSKQAS